MPFFIKRPVVIEGEEYTGANNPFGIMTFNNEGYDGFISTLEGLMKASPGDFIIKGVKGEFYPCKPDIFRATYELVEA